MRAPVFDEESGFSQRAKTGSPHETEKSYVCSFSCNSDETRPDYHSGKRSALEPGRALRLRDKESELYGVCPRGRKRIVGQPDPRRIIRTPLPGSAAGPVVNATANSRTSRYAMQSVRVGSEPFCNYSFPVEDVILLVAESFSALPYGFFPFRERGVIVLSLSFRIMVRYLS